MNWRAKGEELRLALMLLTRIPCGRLADPAPSFADSAWAYPLAGLPVGLAAGATYLAASWLSIPPLAAALLAITIAILTTGAMHEDGLADVADGFGGGRDQTAKLEIMRDSRVGTYGVVAVVLAIGLIASAVATLPATPATLLAFLFTAAASRAMMLVPMTFLLPARRDGLGAQAKLTSPTALFTALGIALVLALPILWSALIALWVMGVIAFTMTWLAKRQIQGQSGDVLGATQKLSEIAGWLTLAALA